MLKSLRQDHRGPEEHDEGEPPQLTRQIAREHVRGAEMGLDEQQVAKHIEIHQARQALAAQREADNATACAAEMCNKPSPKKKTFDNRLIDDIEPSEGATEKPFQAARHNFDEYQFRHGDGSAWRTNEYKKQFVYAKNNINNKKQIYNKMVELIYLNASQHIDKAAEHHPQIFHANRNMWF